MLVLAEYASVGYWRLHMKHLKYPRLPWLAQEVQNHLTAKNYFGYGKVNTINPTQPILFAFRERLAKETNDPSAFR